eukprot:c20143_g2_i2.p3 GENE.c20143_g2_i2~~c20143_g2_i2.p3  ORF type:complete len:116 (+),score=10.22 c20143_g2_i2:276-623(+)
MFIRPRSSRAKERSDAHNQHLFWKTAMSSSAKATRTTTKAAAASDPAMIWFIGNLFFSKVLREPGLQRRLVVFHFERGGEETATARAAARPATGPASAGPATAPATSELAATDEV